MSAGSGRGSRDRNEQQRAEAGGGGRVRGRPAPATKWDATPVVLAKKMVMALDNYKYRYIEWVKNQTEPQETAEDSFQDIKPADLYKESFG